MIRLAVVTRVPAEGEFGNMALTTVWVDAQATGGSPMDRCTGLMAVLELMAPRADRGQLASLQPPSR